MKILIPFAACLALAGTALGQQQQHATTTTAKVTGCIAKQDGTLTCPTFVVVPPPPSDRLRLYAKRAKMERHEKEGIGFSKPVSCNPPIANGASSNVGCFERQYYWLPKCSPPSIGNFPEVFNELNADSVVYCLYVEPETSAWLPGATIQDRYSKKPETSN